VNNINDVYQYVSSILRKQYSGSMSNDQFNQWAGVAQQIHLLVKCGLPEDYKIDLGAPAPGQRRAVIAVRESAQEIEATNTISDEMYPFLAETTLFSTNNRLQFLLIMFDTDRAATKKSFKELTLQRD